MKGTKEEYIEAWTSQAESFYRLAYCSDPELNSEVTACIKKLKELIPKVADTKTSFTR